MTPRSIPASLPRLAFALLSAAALMLPRASPAQARADPEQGEKPAEKAEGRDVYLSTAQGVERIAVALPDPIADPGLEPAARRVLEVVRNDLHFTGLFSIVDPALYDLATRDAVAGEPAAVTAKRWQSIGAAYLLRSRLGGGRDSLVLEAYLVDLASGDEVMGKRYRGGTDLERRMGHHLAEDVLVYFTGSRSVFTTHLIYTSRRGDVQEVFSADYDGANEKQLTQTGSLNLSPAVAPDGTVAVFTSFVSGAPRLHVVDLRTGKMRKLYDCPGTCQSAAWSPDGRRLAFSLSYDGNAEIVVLDRDAGEPVRLTRHPAIDVSPTWSPTGDEIAFVSDRSGHPQIHVMDRLGLNERRLTYAFEQATDPAWSPGGDRIAYTARVDGENRVCLLDLARSVESCLPPIGSGDESPAWSPDGSYLVFLAVTGGSPVLTERRADGVGNAQPVFVRGEPRTPSWFE